MAETMYVQLAQLLSDTQLPAEGPRKQAELHLQQIQTNPEFPSSLLAIGHSAELSSDIRQAALLILRTFVDKNWSGQDENGPTILIDEATKERIRVRALELATSSDENRKIKSSARYAITAFFFI